MHDDIKVGDRVVLRYWGSFRLGRIVANVERVTKTQFRADGQRFRKSDGRRVLRGSGWNAIPTTPELIAEIETEQHNNTLIIESLRIMESINRKLKRSVAKDPASTPDLTTIYECLMQAMSTIKEVL